MESPFGWPGGKRLLKKTLLQLIPKHRAYVEVFAGSAKLLFAKEPSHWEVINDVNDELINFFRVVKHRASELAESLEREIVGRARFWELRDEPKQIVDSRNEVERAHRFIYLVWHSFGSMGETFGSRGANVLASNQAVLKKSMESIRETLDKCADRLRRVLVDKRDFADCIARYDSRDTFFYLDPPYSDFEPNGQYEPFSEARIRELFARLRKIKGKFLLSFDDSKIVRESARGFHVKPVSVLYTLCASQSMSRKNCNKAPELLIANYPLTLRKS